jgi:hypothetical protein
MLLFVFAMITRFRRRRNGKGTQGNHTDEKRFNGIHNSDVL